MLLHHRRRKAPILRLALLRDIEIGQQFDPRTERRIDIAVEDEDLFEHAVDSRTHDTAGLGRFDMDIAAAADDRSLEYQFDQLEDTGALLHIGGRLGGKLLSDIGDQILDALGDFDIVQMFVDLLRIGNRDLDQFVAKYSMQLLLQRDIERILDRYIDIDIILFVGQNPQFAQFLIACLRTERIVDLLRIEIDEFTFGVFGKLLQKFVEVDREVVIDISEQNQTVFKRLDQQDIEGLMRHDTASDQDRPQIVTALFELLFDLPDCLLRNDSVFV